MYRVCFLILLYFFSSCESDKKNDISGKKSPQTSHRFITLIIKNAPEVEFISLKDDSIFGGRIYFENIAYVLNFNGIKEYLKPINRLSIDTVNVFSDEKNIEISFYQKRLSEKSFLFFNGDTALVSYNNNGIPKIEIKNRKTNVYDYSFEDYKNIILEKDKTMSAEERYFRYLSYPSEKVSKEELLDFWRKNQDKNSKNLMIILSKEKKLLDSLYDLKLLSNNVYDYYIDKTLYSYYSLLANEKVLPKPVINKNIDQKLILPNEFTILKNQETNLDLNYILNNNTLNLKYGFYKDFFEFYYVPKYYEENTVKTTNTFQNFGGTHYEYTVVFDSISKGSYFSKEIKEYLLFNYMNKIAENFPPKIVDLYYKKYKNQVKNQEYSDIINSKYKLDSFSTDKLTLVDCNQRKSFLEDIIKKNAGKVIFLNFWASWCGPCIKSIPKLNDLKNEYSDQVVFIDISTENKFDDWLSSKAYSEMDKSSNNYILTNPYLSNFLKENHVDFVPRYMLIDKNGNLVQSDIQDISGEEVKQLLNKYLQN